MDSKQNDHLKAYGLAFWVLNQQINVEWLLNYRGGSFLIDNYSMIENECKLRGILYESVNASVLGSILGEIESNNMDIVLLEKAPKIAVYSPPGTQPWDDAVTLALTYAEVEYDIIFDEEVLSNGLSDYDWLHLHHEDFTGQYGKFYRNYRNAAWYKQLEYDFNNTASQFGFESVHVLKKNVAWKIKEYIINGGFIFAMCSAADSFDIALATIDVDIALGFDVMLKKQRIRLYGMNTPESRTRDLEEKKYGLAAKARLKELLEEGETLSLRTAIDKKARGKYGRILGTIYADGVNLNDLLIEEGHAIEYFGGTKNTTKWWLENKKEEKSPEVNWDC